jgi:hypothetical protein
MNLKKNYFKNLSQSPIRQNADDSFYNSVGQQNQRIMKETQAKRKAIIDENEHVSNVRGGVNTVVDNALEGDYTRNTFGREWEEQGDGEYAKVRDLENPIEVKGGELIDDKTWNTIDQGTGYGCVSFSCAILKKAEARVPMNDAGGVWIGQGTKAEKFYKSGDPLPIIWNNQNFDKNAKALGFELQEPGTKAITGDVLRDGYNYGTRRESGTSHSMVATDSITDQQLARGPLTASYMSQINEGIQQDYNPDTWVNIGYDFNEDGNKDKEELTNRIQRYVGSTPYLEDNFEKYKNDENNQLKSISTLKPFGQVDLNPTPKVDIIARANPNVLTKKQIKKLKRK